MKSKWFYLWAYITVAVMTAVMTGVSLYATLSGDGALFKGPLVYILFGIYFAVQIVCIFFFKPGAGAYKIGFYFTHVGILVILIGALLFAVFGQTVYSEVPIDESGKYYVAIGNGEDRTELGFGIRADSLTVERYADGSDRSYSSELTLFDVSKNTGLYHESGKKTLAVNAPLHKNGWKLYFMSYNDGRYSGDGGYLLPAAVSADGEMKERESLLEFTAGSGTEALARIMADGSLTGGDITYLVYDRSSGTYVISSPSDVAASSGLITVRVYTSSVGGYAAYVSGNSLLVLFKKDPGEYFVICGMALTVIGVVMMCLIKKRTKLTASAETAKDADAEKRGDAG